MYLINRKIINSCLVIMFLGLLIVGSFYLNFSKRHPRILSVEEMVEMQVPEWYQESLVVSHGGRFLSITPLAIPVYKNSPVRFYHFLRLL